MGSLMEMITGLKFKKKKAAAFGCYGWSGESVKVLNEGLEKAGFEIVHDPLSALWQPGPGELDRAAAFGGEFVEKLH